MLRATQRPLGVSGRSPDPVRSDSGVYWLTPMQASPAVIFARFRGFHVQQLHRVFAVRSPLKRLRNRDRMCNRITAHARRYDYHLVRASPRHPASVKVLNVASGSLPLPRRFARYARSSTCGERDHLSHVVGDPGVVLLGMSRQIAPQTRSKALRRTKRVLDARQGMEGTRKTLTEALRRSSAPIPLTRGFQVARNRASPCKAHLHGTGSHTVGRWS